MECDNHITMTCQCICYSLRFATLKAMYLLLFKTKPQVPLFILYKQLLSKWVQALNMAVHVLYIFIQKQTRGEIHVF